MNEEFYTAVDEDKDFFILSIDTSKAFDSIFVDYLHAVLRAISMPEWFINLVHGLYHRACGLNCCAVCGRAAPPYHPSSSPSHLTL